MGEARCTLLVCLEHLEQLEADLAGRRDQVVMAPRPGGVMVFNSFALTHPARNLADEHADNLPRDLVAVVPGNAGPKQRLGEAMGMFSA